MYIKLLMCSAGRLEVVGYLVNIKSLFDVYIHSVWVCDCRLKLVGYLECWIEGRIVAERLKEYTQY